MTNSGNGPRRNLSRRRLIGRAAGLGLVGAGLALSTREAAAQKLAQQAAQYQESPKNGQQCSTCALFEPPASCKIVDGAISPQGWCKFYVKKAG
jgi:hypothetical protein